MANRHSATVGPFRARRSSVGHHGALSWSDSELDDWIKEITVEAYGDPEQLSSFACVLDLSCSKRPPAPQLWARTTMAGLLDAAVSLTPEARVALTELGCAWPNGTVRLRAFKLLAETTRTNRRRELVTACDPASHTSNIDHSSCSCCICQEIRRIQGDVTTHAAGRIAAVVSRLSPDERSDRTREATRRSCDGMGRNTPATGSSGG